MYEPKKKALKTTPSLLGKPLPNVQQLTYLVQLFSDDAKFSAHIKKRTKKKKAATWRWKASNVSRRHGKTSLGAEKLIHEAGEKASGLYGAEAWCSMHGSRYDELSDKQGQIERERERERCLAFSRNVSFGEHARNWEPKHGTSKSLL